MINRVSVCSSHPSQRQSAQNFGTAFKIKDFDSANPIIERISENEEILKLGNYTRAAREHKLNVTDASLDFDAQKNTAFIKTEVGSADDKLRLEIQKGIHKPFLNIFAVGEEEGIKYRFVQDKVGAAAEACKDLLTSLGLPF